MATECINTAPTADRASLEAVQVSTESARPTIEDATAAAEIVRAKFSEFLAATAVLDKIFDGLTYEEQYGTEEGLLVFDTGLATRGAIGLDTSDHHVDIVTGTIGVELPRDMTDRMHALSPDRGAYTVRKQVAVGSQLREQPYWTEPPKNTFPKDSEPPRYGYGYEPVAAEPAQKQPWYFDELIGKCEKGTTTPPAPDDETVEPFQATPVDNLDIIRARNIARLGLDPRLPHSIEEMLDAGRGQTLDDTPETEDDTDTDTDTEELEELVFFDGIFGDEYTTVG